MGWGTVHSRQGRTILSQKKRAASCGGWSLHGHMEQWLGAQPGATLTTTVSCRAGDVETRPTLGTTNVEDASTLWG